MAGEAGGPGPGGAGWGRSPPGEGGRAERDGIGVFPGWRWLYAAVIVYTGLLVVLLWWLTRVLDHSRG